MLLYQVSFLAAKQHLTSSEKFVTTSDREEDRGANICSQHSERRRWHPWLSHLHNSTAFPVADKNPMRSNAYEICHTPALLPHFKGTNEQDTCWACLYCKTKFIKHMLDIFCSTYSLLKHFHCTLVNALAFDVTILQEYSLNSAFLEPFCDHMKTGIICHGRPFHLYGIITN